MEGDLRTVVCEVLVMDVGMWVEDFVDMAVVV